jgi:sporulation protein YlmC with PRC-barrel domain
MQQFDLIRDVLDKQLVDDVKKQMGRVDGIVLELREGEPPRVDHFEVGFAVLAERVLPRAGKWVDRLPWSVPWDKVREVTQHHIILDFDAERTPAFDWELWLRKHIVDKLPGGKEKD